MKKLNIYTYAILLMGTLSSYGMHPSQNIIMEDSEEKNENSVPSLDLQRLERKQKIERNRVMERVDAVRNAPAAMDHLLNAGNPEENPQLYRNRDAMNELQERTRAIRENPNDEYARERTFAQLRVDRARNAPDALDYFPLNLPAHTHSHNAKEYLAHIRAHTHSHSHAQVERKEKMHDELKEFHITKSIQKAHRYWVAFANDLEREIPGFIHLSEDDQNNKRLEKAFDALRPYLSDENPNVQHTFYELTEMFLRGRSMDFSEKTHPAEFLILNQIKAAPLKTEGELNLLMTSLKAMRMLKHLAMTLQQ